MNLLDVKNLKTYYFSPIGSVKAVDGVSFTVKKGETLGIAGESGCGKTTVALCLMNLLPPTGKILGGSIMLEDIDIISMSEKELERVRWKKISIIFQGSMNALNPVRKIEDQIAEAIVEHEKVEEKEAIQRSRELLSLVGIEPKRGGEYPHEFSGGMKQRVMIAMALACNPNLVIADEPTMALDVMVQAQIMDLINKLRKELGLSMVLITHDLGILAENCDKIAIMYAGKIVEYAPILSLFRSPMHPYTNGLLKALPRMKGPSNTLYSIPGTPPNLVAPPSGCRFHPRCIYSDSVCRQTEPELIEIGENHYVSCHKPMEKNMIQEDKNV